MAYGGEGGENVRFKHKKNQFLFESFIYIYICWSYFFSLQSPFVEL
jgi:hypothetical protein